MLRIPVICLWVLAPAAMAADVPPALCSGVAVGLKLDPNRYMYPRMQSLSEIVDPEEKECRWIRGCGAGIGDLNVMGNARNPQGLSVAVWVYDSAKTANAKLAREGPPNSKGYGDAASVQVRPVALPEHEIEDIIFTLGPYYVRIAAQGQYRPYVAKLARYIEPQLRQLPQTCRADAPKPLTQQLPEASQVECPGTTDKATVNLSWSPGRSVRDVTIKVGTGAGGSDIAKIGPIKGTGTYVNGIPPGKLIHVTASSYFSDGTTGETKCSFRSVGDAGIELAMRVYPNALIDGSPYRRIEPAASPESCRADCLADPSCKAFTYFKPKAGRAASCSLKAAPGNMVTTSCCISGVRGPAPGVPPKVGSGGIPVRLEGASAGPNPRNSNQPPALAVDGNIATYTWTTESWSNVQPSELTVQLGAASSVGRIRLYKDTDSGGAGPTAKDLAVEYTASPRSVPAGSRQWQRVTGLRSGHGGAEMWKAISIMPNGGVSGDLHDSAVDGWGSLSFNPVTATAIRIRFSNPAGSRLRQNHYRVYEFQVYGPE